MSALTLTDNRSAGSITLDQGHQGIMSEKTSATDLKDVEPKETEAAILPNVAREPEGDIEMTLGAPGEPPKPMFNPADFPDGGFDAWLVVAGGFACLFVSFGWVNAIGVFQEYYQTHELSQYSASTISWIPSLEAFMMFAGGPIVGRLYDSYGPRGILAIGSFLHVFGLMMTSLCKEYYQFILAQGICSPIGSSMVFYAAMSTVPGWFFKWRALAFGCMAAGSSLGGVIFPIMISHLIPEVGFPWSMRIAAFIILGLLIFANLTVKARLPPKPKPLRLQEFLDPFKELPFILTAMGCWFFFLGMFLPINYLIVQSLQEIHMSARLANYIIPILNALSLFGRVLPGYVGDLYGRYNVISVLSILTAIFVLGLWIPTHSNASVIAFAAIYGFGTGAFVSMAPALLAQITRDLSKIGTRTGSMFAVISTAALISNPIAGAIVDSQNGKFIGLQIFCGVVQLVGAGFLVACRLLLGGPKPLTKV